MISNSPNMKPVNLLREPEPESYIWKYFDAGRDYIKLRTFLSGEIFFSNLLGFNDYLEGISPLFYYLLQGTKYNFILRHKKYFEKEGAEKLFFSFRNARAVMHLGLFNSGIKKLLREKVEDEDKRK
jgi:hypothetical protein